MRTKDETQVDASIVAALQDHLDQCYRTMPFLPALCAGTLSEIELRSLALSHYVETKSFINIKNPARLYLCPHGEVVAQRYFWYLYKEEQGDFREGKNHADLFKPVCFHLGISEDELEGAYETEGLAWRKLFEEVPSVEAMVRELGISVAWESLVPYFGSSLIDSLRDNYGFGSRELHYFELHYTLDQAHSKKAVQTLAHYCTDDKLRAIALNAIRDSLHSDVHLAV